METELYNIRVRVFHPVHGTLVSGTLMRNPETTTEADILDTLEVMQDQMTHQAADVMSVWQGKTLVTVRKRLLDESTVELIPYVVK